MKGTTLALGDDARENYDERITTTYYDDDI